MEIMKNTRRLLAAAAAAVVFVASASGAGYIRFDGVDGESTDAGHDKWIDLQSISQSIQRSPSGGTGGATRGVLQFGDIVCTKELDKSSPKLAEAICQGAVFPRVEIELTAAYGPKRVTYYRYELKNVLVTSYSLSGDARGGVKPAEQLSLNFEEIKVTYTEYDGGGGSKGNVEYEWKVEKGE